MINVTTPFLPPIEEYQAIIKGIWSRQWLTNNGPLVQQLEQQLKEYLQVDHLLYTNNGTVVLQMALKLLPRQGEVITTPFSYVATTNAILWEGFTPVFVDIKATDYNINETLIEAAITPNTVAIMATHVYGNPCNVEVIQAIATKHNLTVIYDAAHTFGTLYKGKQLLSYGDIATCSFHATKVFHTIEGGCIICKDAATETKLKLMRSFGHIGDEYYSVGINGKNSEFHAAMGLCNLPHLQSIIEARKQCYNYYCKAIANMPLQIPVPLDATSYNYAYFPVIFDSEIALQNTVAALLQNNINARRYFYPSLNELPFVIGAAECTVSEAVSTRALSLPLSNTLALTDIDTIVAVIKSVIGEV